MRYCYYYYYYYYYYVFCVNCDLCECVRVLYKYNITLYNLIIKKYKELVTCVYIIIML